MERENWAATNQIELIIWFMILSDTCKNKSQLKDLITACGERINQPFS